MSELLQHTNLETSVAVSVKQTLMLLSEPHHAHMTCELRPCYATYQVPEPGQDLPRLHVLR